MKIDSGKKHISTLPSSIILYLKVVSPSGCIWATLVEDIMVSTHPNDLDRLITIRNDCTYAPVEVNSTNKHVKDNCI